MRYFADGYSLGLVGLAPDFYFRWAEPPFDLWHDLFSHSKSDGMLLRLLVALKGRGSWASLFGDIRCPLFTPDGQENIAALARQGLTGGTFFWQVAFTPTFDQPLTLLRVPVPPGALAIDTLMSQAPACPVVPSIHGTFVRLMYDHTELCTAAFFLALEALGPWSEVLIPPLLPEGTKFTAEFLPGRLKKAFPEKIEHEVFSGPGIEEAGLVAATKERRLAGGSSGIMTLPVLGGRTELLEYQHIVATHDQTPRTSLDAATSYLTIATGGAQLNKGLTVISVSPGNLWLTPLLRLPPPREFRPVDAASAEAEIFNTNLPREDRICVGLYTGLAKEDIAREIAIVLNKAIRSYPRKAQWNLKEFTEFFKRQQCLLGVSAVACMTLVPQLYLFKGSPWLAFSVSDLDIFLITSGERLSRSLISKEEPAGRLMGQWLEAQARPLPVTRLPEVLQQVELMGTALVATQHTVDRCLTVFDSILPPKAASLTEKGVGFFRAAQKTMNQIAGCDLGVHFQYRTYTMTPAGAPATTLHELQVEWNGVLHHFGVQIVADGWLPYAAFELLGVPAPIVGTLPGYAAIYSNPATVETYRASLAELLIQDDLKKFEEDHTDVPWDYIQTAAPAPLPQVRGTSVVASNTRPPGAKDLEDAASYMIKAWKPEALARRWHALSLLQSMGGESREGLEVFYPYYGTLVTKGGTLPRRRGSRRGTGTDAVTKNPLGENVNGYLCKTEDLDSFSAAHLPGLGWTPLQGKYEDAILGDVNKCALLLYDQLEGMVLVNLAAVHKALTDFHPFINPTPPALDKYDNEKYNNEMAHLLTSLPPRFESSLWKPSEMAVDHMMEGRLLMVAPKFSTDAETASWNAIFSGVSPTGGSVPLRYMPFVNADSPTVLLDPRGFLDSPRAWFRKDGDLIPFELAVEQKGEMRYLSESTRK